MEAQRPPLLGEAGLVERALQRRGVMLEQLQRLRAFGGDLHHGGPVLHPFDADFDPAELLRRELDDELLGAGLLRRHGDDNRGELGGRGGGAAAARAGRGGPFRRCEAPEARSAAPGPRAARGRRAGRRARPATSLRPGHGGRPGLRLRAVRRACSRRQPAPPRAERPARRGCPDPPAWRRGPARLRPLSARGELRAMRAS